MTERIELPLPNPNRPMVTRMLSQELLPPEPLKDGRGDVLLNASGVPVYPQSQPVAWILLQNHPLVGNMKIVRMFSNDADVEVYSVSSDGKTGHRTLIPMSRVRLIEEAMTLDTFIAELEEAEEDEDEEDESDPEPETEAEIELDETTTTTPANAPS